MDVTGWATIATAAFTALAAGAAWRAVVLQGRSLATLHEPHVSASFLNIREPRPHQRIEFVNSGPGLAAGLMFFGVEGAASYSGLAGKGHLLPGEKDEVLLPPMSMMGTGEATFVWGCRDIHNTAYVWTYDGRVETRHFDPEKPWPTLVEEFKRLYPDAAIPEDVEPHSAGPEIPAP